LHARHLTIDFLFSATGDTPLAIQLSSHIIAEPLVSLPFISFLIVQHPFIHAAGQLLNMHFSVPTIIVAGLAVGQAAATGWRLDAHQYSSPYNTNNECSAEQKPGYNWDNLEPGSFDSYGSNKFSGFKCGNSFGKRDGVSKRLFQDKCITADIDKEPKIECNGKDKMTIDSYQVSSSWDTDVDAHHEMPDGSVCKQTHRCTKGGNTVQNTQCAGSTKVTFKPKKGESGKNEKGESCSIGIHSIGFNCGEASSSSTQPAYSAPATSSAPAYSSSVIESTSATESSTSAVSTSETTSSVVDTTSSTEGSPATSSVPSIPAYSSYANVSTTYSATSAVILPSTSNEMSPSSTDVSPEGTTSSYLSFSTTAHNSSAPVYSATTSSDVEVPSQTYEAPNTPDLLPQCINTWIGQSDCKDNADFSCYCRNSDLITKVMGCIDAWSDDDDKTQSAAGYLQGICAPYVPQNPAIITACPSGSKPPTSSATTTAPVSEVPGETAPVNELSSTEGSPVTTAPVEMTTSTVYSTTVSTITSCAVDVEDCPAVSQTTAVVTEMIAVSTTVCPVSDSEQPKPTTEISPGLSSSSVPADSTTTTQEASTIIYYSTSAVTIISCAEDVTDCPASSTVVSSSEIPISYSVVTTPEASSPASPEQTTIPTVSEGVPTSESEYPAPTPYASITSAATAPGSTIPAPSGPSTIITYSSSIEVPASYTTGESLGQPIPGSTTFVTIDTTITVPQVQFVTSTISVPGSTSTISVGLAAGPPSEVPAYPTSTADSVGGAASSSGFGTSYVPSSTGSPITPYEGGAPVARTGFVGLVGFAGAVVFFVL
jgi:hypothetical protein